MLARDFHFSPWSLELIILRPVVKLNVIVNERYISGEAGEAVTP